MDLREFLCREYVESELAADYLIKNGLIELNGKVITDPTIPAGPDDRLEIEERQPPLRMDAADSYWCGRIIQEETGFIERGDAVLILGNGGMETLVRDFGAEAFRLDEEMVTPDEIEGEVGRKPDMVIWETDTDALRTIQNLEKISSIFRKGSSLLFFLSSVDRETESLVDLASQFLPGMGMETVRSFEFPDGIYVYARRRSEAEGAAGIT